MKKILLLCLFIILLIPTANAVYSFSNLGSDRTAVFVSKYSSTSMDDNTLDYYERIKNVFSIDVIKDTWVVENKIDWRDAYQDADLVFVISLSDEVLTTSRDLFCGNLSVVLEKTKGIVFAGNSLISSPTTLGCPYTSYFNLATQSNNIELKNNTVRITKEHPITNGYELKEYNISVQDTIYTIVSPEDGTNLGTVYGDPDGSGSTEPGDYSFLTTWESLTYRVAVWGINTSYMTGCENCLGWVVFDQLLEWASNTGDIGFKIHTDKELYTPGERIYINITSPVDLMDISGNVTYPDQTVYELFLSGSGRKWNSIYLLENDALSGNYSIDVIADGVKKTKKISVKAFNLALYVNNQTEQVGIEVEVMDLSGKIKEDVNVTINITNPLSQKENHSYSNTGFVYLVYNVSESGEHRVYAEAIDPYGRKESETKTFFFFLRPNITFSPENVARVVTEPTVITFLSVEVMNQGKKTLTDIRLSRTGQVKNWIELEKTQLPDIEVGDYETVRFNITVPEEDQGVYTGSIRLTSDHGEVELPISIQIKYLGILSVSPSSWDGWIPVDQRKTIQFELKNDGKGNVTITSVNIVGDLTDHANIVKYPRRIGPGRSDVLEILVTTSGIGMYDLTENLSGSVEIMTDQGLYYPVVALDVIVVENLLEKVDSLSGELSVLEQDLTNIGKIVDVSDLRQELDDAKTDLEGVKTSYNQEDYETAVAKFNSVESSVDALKSKISQKQREIWQGRLEFVKNVAIFFGVVIVAVVGWFIFRIIRKKREYEWLYKKWKR